MKNVCVVVVMSFVGVAGSAQSPAPSSSLAGPSDASEAPKDWALATDADAAVDLRPLVIGHGPGIKIRAPAGLTIVRPGWTLTGTYTVSALFQRTPASATSAGYGLMVGVKSAADSGMAFLVRADGQFAIGTLSALTWAPTSGLRPATANGPAVDRLEVRVRAAEAVFVVNGQPLGVAPITPGALDGRPGVHIAAGGDVLVAAFALQGAQAIAPLTTMK